MKPYAASTTAIISSRLRLETADEVSTSDGTGKVKLSVAQHALRLTLLQDGKGADLMSKSNGDVPRELGKYALDVGSMRAGDVILTTDKSSWKSSLIRVVTAAKFSHAILCVDPPWCVESADNDVVYFRVDRLLIENPEHVAILRLKPEYGPLEQTRAACANALRFVDLTYNTKGALVAPFPWIENLRQIPWIENLRQRLVSSFESAPQVDPRTFFCSELIAAAFATAGIDLQLGPAKYVVPGRLAESPAFKDIAKSCIREATPGDRLGWTGTLGGPADNRAQAAAAHSRQTMIRIAGEFFAEKGLPVPHTYAELRAAVRHEFMRGDSERRGWIDLAVGKAISESRALQEIDELFPVSHPTFQQHVRIASDVPGMSSEEVVATLDYYARRVREKRQDVASRREIATMIQEAAHEMGSEALRLFALIETQLLERDMLALRTYRECVSVLVKNVSADLAAEYVEDEDEETDVVVMRFDDF